MGYAITARYVGPTNYRGSRVIATGPALTHDGPPVRATVSWDYGAGNPAPLAETRPEGHCNVPYCPGYQRNGQGPHDILKHRQMDAEHNAATYAGWGDHDANYRRAADAVVAKLRAAGWSVSLAPDDRGALLPDERTTVYVLRYGREACNCTPLLLHATTCPAALRADPMRGPEDEPMTT